jgi:hypothetical protein
VLRCCVLLCCACVSQPLLSLPSLWPRRWLSDLPFSCIYNSVPVFCFSAQHGVWGSWSTTRMHTSAVADQDQRLLYSCVYAAHQLGSHGPVPDEHACGHRCPSSTHHLAVFWQQRHRTSCCEGQSCREACQHARRQHHTICKAGLKPWRTVSAAAAAGAARGAITSAAGCAAVHVSMVQGVPARILPVSMACKAVPARPQYCC